MLMLDVILFFFNDESDQPGRYKGHAYTKYHGCIEGSSIFSEVFLLCCDSHRVICNLKLYIICVITVRIGNNSLGKNIKECWYCLICSRVVENNNFVLMVNRISFVKIVGAHPIRVSISFFINLVIHSVIVLCVVVI
jgi:hypothetical protein